MEISFGHFVWVIFPSLKLLAWGKFSNRKSCLPKLPSPLLAKALSGKWEGRQFGDVKVGGGQLLRLGNSPEANGLM